MAERFDVVVVGASPSGLVTSIRLARQGLRVALLEQPLNIQGVMLLSLPALRDALGDEIRDASLMRRMVRCRRVSADGANWAATEFVLGDASKAELVSVEMDDFLSGLGRMADQAGVNRRAGASSLIRDARGAVLGCRTADDDEILARVAVIADGAGSAFAEELSPAEETLAEDQVLYAERSWRLDERTIDARLGVETEDGALTMFTGSLAGGLPTARAWLYPGAETLTLCLQLPRAATDEAHLSAGEILENLASHAALRALLEGARAEEPVFETRDRGGLSRLRSLFGDGWMIAGRAAGIFDPFHPFELRYELTSGAAAADACLKACEAGDAGALTTGLYKRILMDGYIRPELKEAEAERKRRFKNPDLDGFYPGMFVRRLALDLASGLAPRGDARREFNEETLTERPLWDLVKAGVGGFRLFG